MTSANARQGAGYADLIDKITAVQAQHALSGSKVHIVVTNADKSQVLVTDTKLKEILGDTTYNTICSTALTSLNTALASLKTSTQTTLAALVSGS